MGGPAGALAGVEAAQGLCMLLLAEPWSTERTSIADSWSAAIAEGERWCWDPWRSVLPPVLPTALELEAEAAETAEEKSSRRESKAAALRLPPPEPLALLLLVV
mmetsp:Transcript_132090/g.246980  ORF Transcript_132090/g.246980 Transcript_132090/m.246980 type:complete len:104 (-) Transcript_132090:19-330(-)